MASILKKKPSNQKKRKTGTKEWADTNVNIASGCTHDCRYCYAKKMALRFGRETKDSWKIMNLNQTSLKKGFTKRKGRIMFPSSHDITPEILESSISVLTKMLEVGNEVLITTKPHFECIKQICTALDKYKSQIQFRFTIGSNDNKLLQFWEPGAPLFEERLKSLKYAFDKNYKTSVSTEPFLDHNPIPLVNTISPFTSETIWIGKMNYIARNGLKQDEIPFYNQIRENCTKKNILSIYNKLFGHPKIRWKDSIKKMLNL